MVRFLPLANGRLKVSFDENYRIADFYFSESASENHAGRSPFKSGISIDRSFYWLDRKILMNFTYYDSTLVGSVSYSIDGISVENYDCVDIYKDVYLRKVRVTNNSDRKREVKFFYHQNFNISGSDVGDTAQYVPELRGVMHYKGNRYFLASSIDSYGNTIDQYATGVEQFDGKEGTWKDAEDIELSMNPVSIGSVDSVIRHSLTIEPGATSEFFYFIACADQMRALTEVKKGLGYSDFEKMLTRTSNYWRLWASKRPLMLGNDTNIAYRLSLLVARTHINEMGAIVASCDSDVQSFNRDGYYYVWPRDASIVAYSILLGGHGSAARRFFRFCDRALSEDGYLHHKYRADGAPASSWLPHVIRGKQILPIQEDETSLVLWALRRYYLEYSDVEFVASIYESLIKKTADFIVSFTDEQGLPRESFDIWEERYGIHAYTVSTAYAALKSAAFFAETFGDIELSIRYNNSAERMSDAFERLFYSEEKGQYARAIIDGKPDFTIDSALSSMFIFGMRDPLNPRVQSTMQKIISNLWVEKSGGFARYENDPYQKDSSDGNATGNPWIITTLWVAQYHIATGDTLSAEKLIDWVMARRNSTGILPEQIKSSDLSHASASPLVWSHAELVITLVQYSDALKNRNKSGEDPLAVRSEAPSQALS